MNVAHREKGGYARTQQASTPVRSLHKLGLGINLGGTLFGLTPPDPTVKHASDKSARGRVRNTPWTRSQAVATLARANRGQGG